jgi:TRAP-type C4-dicarboxylate transport system substrate-binding protein
MTGDGRFGGNTRESIMMKLGRMTAIAAIVVSLAGGAAAQQAAPPVTLRIGHVDAQTTHSGVGADAFAAAAARLSNGAIKIEVFHAGQLGPIPEQIRNVITGTQDMHLLFPEFLTTLIDESKVISAPFLFKSHAHQQAFFKSEIFKPALDKLRSLGALMIDEDWTWWQMDPRGVVSTRPIKSPDDLKGLKLRLWESRTAIATWQGFGAETRVVPRPEMYLAFKQGLIEGGPETIGIAVDQKNVEVAKHWTRTDEYFQILNILVNARKWQSLTEAQRGILRQAAKEAGETFRKESERGFTEKRQRAEKEYGVTVYEPDLTPWRRMSPKIIETLEGDGTIPKGLPARVSQMSGF